MRELHLDPSDVRFGKWLVLLNGAIPAALLGWDALHHRLGANPVNFAIRSTGFLALIFLMLSLVVTPALKVSGQQWLGHFRRSLGLYAFFHTLLHFSLFFGFDRGGSVQSTLSEMWLRKYLLVGAAGLIMMAPLAVTSTNGMIRRLGPKRWKALHRLAYPAAIAGVAHFYMLQKADVRLPIVYAAVLAVLLGYRIVRHYLDLRLAINRMRATTSAPAPARPTFWKGPLRVTATFDETPEVRTFRLAPLSGTDLPFAYRAGQYMNLALTVNGKRVNRSYTIASSPTRAGHCELTVKREEMGTSSLHLHQAVKVGDVLNVSAPAGKFTLDLGRSESVVMIAGGVGVTPLMSKLRYLTDTAWTGQIFLVFSVRAERDIIFRDELQYLSKRYPNVHVTITLSQPGADWRGERGRVSPELLRRIVPDLAVQSFHICGPTVMADAVRDMLLTMDVPADHIAMESFTSPNRSDVASESVPAAGPSEVSGDGQLSAGPGTTGGTLSVTFARSGKTVEASPDVPLLEVAEAAGVAINFDCRSGICGQCKTKLLSGRVRMDAEDALSESDRAADLILACQAHCLEPVTLDA